MSAQTQDLTTEPEHRLRFHSLQLKNFLSYKDAEIDFSKFIAIIGQNAAGKSNAVAALKLLRDIPEYGFLMQFIAGVALTNCDIVARGDLSTQP